MMWGVDVGLTVTETTRATFRLGNGAYNGNRFSPKLYRSGWGGGSSARISTFKISTVAKVGSYGLAGVGVITDGIGVYKYYTSPNTDPNAFFQPVHPAKAGLNTGVAAYSLFVDPAAGILYFGMEAFYPGGAKGFVNDQSNTYIKLSKECNCDVNAIMIGAMY